MPVTHITFLEPSDDPNNLCYLWIIQSDNSRLPNATMIALTYEQRTMMSNGCLSYKVSSILEVYKLNNFFFYEIMCLYEGVQRKWHKIRNVITKRNWIWSMYICIKFM
jgi:hypothetical protein